MYIYIHIGTYIYIYICKVSKLAVPPIPKTFCGRPPPFCPSADTSPFPTDLRGKPLPTGRALGPDTHVRMYSMYNTPCK